MAKSCLLGLCLFQAHALAVPDSATAPFRLKGDAPQAIRFKLDPIPEEYFSKPVRLAPIEKTLDLRPEADLAAAKTAPRFPIPLLSPPADLANPSLSLGYPFILAKPEMVGAERPVEGIKAVEKAVRDFPAYWAISVILARLDFMKRKASGKLPARPDRLAFTEPLKAWAVNPVFDSTRLREPLLDVCRLYEEMIN